MIASQQPHHPGRWLQLLALVAVLVVAPVAWYLGSPLFINHVVDEAFPAPTPASGVVPTTVAVPTIASPPPVAVATRVPPAAAGDVAPTAPAVLPTATARPMAAAAEPVELQRGHFTIVDALHRAEGQATVYRLPDGQRLLRFQDFKSANGPGLYVYLSGHPMPRDNQQFHTAGAVEIAPLKANIGNQNYTLPADLDLSRFKSVVIYCKPFGVVFSTAELSWPGVP